MKNQAKIGVLGGSGLYEIKSLRNVRQLSIKTPFGDPSGPVTVGELNGIDCAFLPRHGLGHVLLPGEIPARANIWALKSLGVERLIAVSAVGSLREELEPGHFVIPDQIVDRTKGRTSTFFGQGIVAHVTFDKPFCPALSRRLAQKAQGLGLTTHENGVYLCMEGPAFSTKAESQLHRQAGCSIIGMTAIPEAKLAREAEICYSMAALVTDYDCWKEGEEVSNEKVVQTMQANISNAVRLLESFLPEAARLPRQCRCGQALEGAIFTQPKSMDRKAAKRLELLIGRFTRGRR